MNSSSFSKATSLLQAHNVTNNHNPKTSLPEIKPKATQNPIPSRRNFVTTLISTSLALVGLHGDGIGSSSGASVALAESWGTRSFLKERFFEPGLSPEDAVARIKQTAEGMHSLREMVDRMAWSTLPEVRRREYVNTANDLIDNMAEFDYYVRTPKVYESYLYYEKALKNLDDIVAMFA
ncbi:hypothetical protein CISIN_1g029051mg [Citrus sinensis]|uniref:Uncharacterized protein n=1 Tax=Citrus sinensis TaxID=2711 RepID=A0A067H5J3_CITSI|nr:hypothetical protein CISIN_1g029051mg [Citrus sinensis]